MWLPYLNKIMDIYQQTLELCKQYNIKPARSKGQNFLIKEEVYNNIIEAADLKKDNIVLEIGPGLGFLTTKLADKAKQVITIELDDKLAKYLKFSLEIQKIKNVEIINENILDIEIEKLKVKNFEYKIVANLPYNITSIFLRKFLSLKNKPNTMVLMLQKEVAERILAKPGKMSLLAVSVQYYAEPEIIDYVPANAFWPEPQVDSAIVKLKVKSPSNSAGRQKSPACQASLRTGRKVKQVGVDKERDFFRLIKFGFSSKRKMLKNNLSVGYKITQELAENKLKQVGFDPKIRAQELSVEGWVKLFGEFN